MGTDWSSKFHLKECSSEAVIKMGDNDYLTNLENRYLMLKSPRSSHRSGSTHLDRKEWNLIFETISLDDGLPEPRRDAGAPTGEPEHLHRARELTWKPGYLRDPSRVTKRTQIFLMEAVAERRSQPKPHPDIHKTISPSIQTNSVNKIQIVFSNICNWGSFWC